MSALIEGDLMLWCKNAITIFVVLSSYLSANSIANAQGLPEHCRKGLELLGNQNINDFQKAALLEMLRNRGCLGGTSQISGPSNFSVQLSSKRTEGEALEAFRDLQRKFPELLADKLPTIRRADLGGNGVFFRATVGPFSQQDQAVGFCARLQSLGGVCVVQRN